MSEWQTDIENAPSGKLHIRGLWVRSANTGRRIYWVADCGYVDEETGYFLTASGDDTGWEEEDYTHWMPLPDPPQ